MIFSVFFCRGAVFFLGIEVFSPFHAAFPALRRHHSLRLHFRQQVPRAHQVVGRRGEREHPLHPRLAAMPQLLQQPNRLHPTKNLFHAFPHALPDFVATVPRRAPVDRAATRPLAVPPPVPCPILPPHRPHQFLL